MLSLLLNLRLSGGTLVGLALKDCSPELGSALMAPEVILAQTHFAAELPVLRARIRDFEVCAKRLSLLRVAEVSKFVDFTGNKAEVGDSWIFNGHNGEA